MKFPIIITNKATGEIKIIEDNIKQFCEENNFEYRAFRLMIAGKTKYFRENWYFGTIPPIIKSRKGEKRKPLTKEHREKIALKHGKKYVGIKLVNKQGEELIVKLNIKEQCKELNIVYSSFLKLLRKECPSISGWYYPDVLEAKLNKEKNKIFITNPSDLIINELPKNKNNIRGIYKITNKINGKYYYGSSMQIGKRWWEHKKQLKLGIHCNPHLQAAWNKYGEDNFLFSLEKDMSYSTEEEILTEEQKYLDNFINNDKCYNIAKIADRPDETLNFKPVIQMDKEGNEIKKWNSMKEAQDVYGENLAIYRVCRGFAITAGGYKWKYADEELSKQFKPRKEISDMNKKRIVRYDPITKTLIKEFDSFTEAGKEYGLKPEMIVPVCTKKRNSIHGMFFKYYDEWEQEQQNTNQQTQIMQQKAFTCKGCGIGFDKPREFATHLQFTHKTKSEDYTIQYFYNGVKPKCFIKDCTNPVSYKTFKFREYCDLHAHSKLKNIIDEIKKISNDIKIENHKNHFKAFLEADKFVIHFYSFKYFEGLKSTPNAWDKYINGEDNGYRKFIIDEYEWNNNSDLIKEMILQRIGKANKIIGARKCSIVQITNKEEEKKFFDRNHISGYTGSQYCVALKDNISGNIISMLSMRKPLQHSGKIEIARFANERGYNVQGGFSKLFKYTIDNFCKQNNYKSIISYCDLKYGEGNVYNKSGFKLLKDNTGISYWYTDGKDKWNRFKFRAQDGLTEKQFAQKHNVYPIYGLGNKLFEYDI